MRIALVLLCTAAAATAQEFVPIGGGSGGSQNRGEGGGGGFGEGPFQPTIINPNDPELTPVHFPGNRPNPVPLFPKTQQAGTPHVAPVDFTFVHKHGFKQPFRCDQTVNSYTSAIGAAHPNIPRTLGREQAYIDPLLDPNSDASKKLAEEKKKKNNGVFYGLAAPIEKLHRADEFAPSNVPLQNPWDQWYDRFTEAPADPRRQFQLTQTARPKIVDIPFYSADRGKRAAIEGVANESAAEAEAEASSTVAGPPGTVPVDAAEIDGTTTAAAAAAAESTSTTAAAALEATSKATVEITTTTVSSTTVAEARASAASTAATTKATAEATAAASSTASPSTTPTTTTTAVAAAEAASSIDGGAETHVSSNASAMTTAKPATTIRFSSTPLASTVAPSTGPTIAFRPHFNRGSKPVATSTRQPPPGVTRLRALNRTKTTIVPLRTTLAGVSRSTAASPSPSSSTAPTTAAPAVMVGGQHSFAKIKLDNNDAVGAALKNPTVPITTIVPVRTTAFRRPLKKGRVPLRKLLANTTKTSATAATTSAAASSSVATTPAASAATVTPATTIRTTSRVVLALKALNAKSNTTRTSTTAKPKAPFRIFSRRPLVQSQLPTKTPILLTNDNSSELDSNSVGPLRTELNRLLSTVITLQSTVIAQQQRIAHLENQLRLRRGAVPRRPATKTTRRFTDAEGRTVERTTVDVKTGRSLRRRQRKAAAVVEGDLRQGSNTA